MIIALLFFFIIYFGVIALMIISMWKVYEKANKPGWAAIVPVYNLIILLEIAKKPTWWVAMYFVPFANIVFMIMTMNSVSKNFGKDEGFTVGLVLLGVVFWPILAFGSARYVDAKVAATSNNDLLDS
ncbi:DUF5684 domain-containing protein [Fluviicola taffensis]|uniref:DUF5684 domain-containing protein n=1 Tax=Fluviicola taffensis TaxID=191579 RepID=UPI003137EF5A